MAASTFYISGVTSIAEDGRLSLASKDQSRWSYNVSDKNPSQRNGFDMTSECTWCGGCDWDENDANSIQCRHCGFSPQDPSESSEQLEASTPTTSLNVHTLSAQYSDLITFDKEVGQLSPPNSPSSLGSVNDRDFAIQEDPVAAAISKEPDVKVIEGYSTETSTSSEGIPRPKAIRTDMQPSIVDFSIEPTVLEIVAGLATPMSQSEEPNPEFIARPVSPRSLAGSSVYEDVSGPPSALSDAGPSSYAWPISGQGIMDPGLETIVEHETGSSSGPSTQPSHSDHPHTTTHMSNRSHDSRQNHDRSIAPSSSYAESSSHAESSRGGSSHARSSYTVAESSHATAGSSHAESSYATASSSHAIASSSHATASSSHAVAESNHSRSSSNISNGKSKAVEEPAKDLNRRSIIIAEPSNPDLPSKNPELAKKKREWYHSSSNATFQFKITPRDSPAAKEGPGISLAELEDDPTAMQRLLACALFLMKDVPDKDAGAKRLDLGLAPSRSAGAHHVNMTHHPKESETDADRAKRLLWKVSFRSGKE